MRRLLCVALTLLGTAIPGRAQQAAADFPIPDETSYLEFLKIPVDPQRPRVFVYTNKKAAFYAGMTTGPNLDPNQGLNVYGRKVLEDYQLAVGGKPLDRSTATSVDVYPHALVRKYPGGIEEEVSMLDGVDALVVTVRGAAGGVSLAPVVAGPQRPDEYDVALTPADGVLATGGRLVVTPKVGGDIAQKSPRTIAVGAEPGTGRPSRAAIAPAAAGFVPGAVTVPRGGRARFLVAVGRDSADAMRTSGELWPRLDMLLSARRSRIAGLLLDTYVDTEDDRFDRALAWMKASGDALVTDQAGPGIWAGLYWFNNYWGRDTFISLPGILLVTGRYDDARRVLESFSTYQKTDEKDPLYGRIPNRVNSPTDIIYNTADGTPWFVREAYEYVLYSGDADFAKSIYPAIKRATDGTIRYRVDPNGLLVHDDADTWMDAKWEGKIPWSPRGDRAVDVQALWHAQLEASAALARMNGDKASADRWTAFAERVHQSFRKLYRDPATGALYDHLNADGTPDHQVRPNQIFALTVPLSPLLTAEEGAPVVRQVVNELTYPYGVASLSQKDENFHPYHRNDERWHFDSAYHNGTVWVWNAGPVISALVNYGRQDFAYELTRSMVDQALDLGAVGTLSELIEAVPKGGRLKLSGTETQAWSVGEFVRNFYQDYLGVRLVPDDANAGDVLVGFSPQVPRALGTVRAVVPMGTARVKAVIAPEAPDRVSVWLSAPEVVPGRKLPVGLAVDPAGKIVKGPLLWTIVPLERGRTNVMALDPTNYSGGDEIRLSFASPQIYPYIKPLTGVPTPVIRATMADVATREPANAKALYEADDPEGDDRGPSGTYTYPTDRNYEPGIMDLTHVRVAADAERYYFTLRFKRLADPGWHPQLGFQLTYAAVAIDTDHVPGSGGVAVGKKSGFTLPAALAFEKIVYLGAGLELADAKNNPILAFTPASPEGALGSARDGVIRFSIPKSYLGEWSPAWRVSVLAGGQDDGGTAGLGEFRAVGRQASQWAGGGAPSDAGAPRVYDVLLPGR